VCSQSLATSQPVERARPLLGTRVDIRVSGLSEVQAHKAIDAAFTEVDTVHQLMSFHEPDSELSRLNRDAAGKPVAVSAHTFAVMRYALDVAEASEGAFDPTVATQLVTWGFLPAPDSRYKPDPRASWRDIELLTGQRIRFHRPLWIDLGGIAKGYAVDCAIDKMAVSPDTQCSVNAGGDLRVRGPAAEQVFLRTAKPGDTVPMLEIENGSIASSSGREHARRYRKRAVGPHVHGVDRRSVGTRSFVSVVAEQCMVADALTKVVLVQGAKANPLLCARGATAYIHTTRGGWRRIGRGS